MIAPQYKLPFISWNDQKAIPLTESWIEESVKQSAAFAGYDNWDWSMDISYVISQQLQSNRQLQITQDDLHHMMKDCLTAIGYTDIAQRIIIAPPKVSISLTELARKAPYELLFFKMLGALLSENKQMVVSCIQLEDLRECVKLISGASKWRQSCQDLYDQIIRFSRENLYNDLTSPVQLVIL
jgi:hypothetical protein